MKTEHSSQLIPEVGADDHVRGREDAPVTLVEYGDFQCPYCGQAFPILKALERRAGNMLRVVFRNFPLSNIHPHAQAAAEAAEAAGAQGKFWEMHDLIFQNQGQLGSADLERYAREIDLDLERFREDLEHGRWRARIRRDFRSGVMSGVNGTPTFFINGVRHDGNYDLDSLLEATARAEMEATA